jgi:hypothetical protein
MDGVSFPGLTLKFTKEKLTNTTQTTNQSNNQTTSQSNPQNATANNNVSINLFEQTTTKQTRRMSLPDLGLGVGTSLITARAVSPSLLSGITTTSTTPTLSTTGATGTTTGTTTPAPATTTTTKTAEEIDMQERIECFKDRLLAIQTELLLDSIALVKNIMEISRKAIYKKEHLQELIGILMLPVTTRSRYAELVQIETQPSKFSSSCCNCNHSVFEEITSIVINQTDNFKTTDAATRMENIFKISLSVCIVS